MSDKFTVTQTANGAIGDWGHVEPATAIEKLRAHYAYQKTQAEAVLAEIEAGQVEVFHQYGPLAATNRRRVHPPHPLPGEYEILLLARQEASGEQSDGGAK